MSRRRRRNAPPILPATRKSNGMKLLNRMSRDHVDLLQNIESAILSAADEHSHIDDCVVHEALESILHDQPPETASSLLVLRSLREIREFRNDVDDELWRDGIRVVKDSVQTHSTLAPGETHYLDFVSPFVS